MSTLASTASALAVSLALSAIFAGPALGTAQVFLTSDGRLSVTVDAVSGGDGDHGVFVEPFVDVTRNGFRAGQTALGVPAIVASIGVGGAPCLTNPVFNDVVCDGLRGSIAMTMGDGNDRVTLSESGGGGDTCLNISGQPTVPANVALGDGDDRLDVITVSGTPGLRRHIRHADSGHRRGRRGGRQHRREGATTGRDDDLLTIDLRDAAPADCESVQQFATDDGPPGRALRQRLRVRRGATVAVKLGCPRTARVTCRGVLTLRPPGGGRALARGRYRVRQGGTASVSLTTRRALPRSVAAETNEQGASKKGPRFSSRLLRVAG